MPTTKTMHARVHFDVETGRPADVSSCLLRRIGGYTRQDRIAAFKIGITCDPATRFKSAYAREYDEMIVVYESRSIDAVSELERLCVEHNWELSDNKAPGGGGDYGHPPYYLYIVIRHP